MSKLIYLEHMQQLKHTARMVGIAEEEGKTIVILSCPRNIVTMKIST